ncbi:MAG: hypothetical protein JST36_07725 [Bacteroidetes bacterium]|nr:hypothetical protein [Bacteroidota bacterium]
MNKSLERRIIFLLLALVIVDLAYSGLQFYQATLDGDMALIILPSPPWAQVLHDPFGWDALIKGNVYAGAGRFVPHWSMYSFYHTVPFWLQYFMSPIDSIYWSGALAKVMIQAGLLYMISFYISGTGKIFNLKFLFAAILVLPLFQTFGYNDEMGLIDPSLTYSFFYGFASIWLLLFFLTFFLYFFHAQALRSGKLLLLFMLPLAWLVAFNGPLNPAIMLLVCGFVALYIIIKGANGWLGQKETSLPFSRTPRLLLWGLVVGSFFASLSFLAGRFNVEGVIKSIPLIDRYSRLPRGIYLFFSTPSMRYLLAVVVIALIAVNIGSKSATKRINRLAIWLGLFSIVYVLLLPLGGFREYRPDILRKDTMQPVIIGIFILYGIVALYILWEWRGIKRILFSGVFLWLSWSFMKVDRLYPDHSQCERTALETIAASPDSIVLLLSPCTVMSWQKITDYHESRYNAQLLNYWKVFPAVKYYYQK